MRDSGVGIAPEVLPRVFELFAQADHSLDRSQGGLCIGLTLVKRLTELHGIAVDVCSKGVGPGLIVTLSENGTDCMPRPSPTAGA